MSFDYGLSSTEQLYESNIQEQWDWLLYPVNHHYHFGIKGPSSNIFENAIYQNVFPFIKYNSRVLDGGCGWGGPAEMLTKYKKCKVTAVSNSRGQIDHIKKRRQGIRALKKDLNTFAPLRSYDVALFYESLCHVQKSERILKKISRRTKNLLIIDHISVETPYYNPYWMMQFETLDGLCKKVERVGYKIQYAADLNFGKYLVPSSLYWKKRLENIPYKTGQFAVLEESVNMWLDDPESFLKQNGLGLVYASK